MSILKCCNVLGLRCFTMFLRQGFKLQYCFRNSSHPNRVKTKFVLGFHIHPPHGIVPFHRGQAKESWNIDVHILWGNKNPWQFWSQNSVPLFVSRTLPTRRILFQRSLQRPQACSLLCTGPHCNAVSWWMGRTAWQTLFTMDGTPLKRLLDYGQGHISTLFSMDGSAPKHSSLWAGPHRAFITMGGPAPGHSLLWAGPQRARITMGGPAPVPHRARTGPSLLWAGPHRETHYYGRARSGPAFLWAGPPHRLDLTK